MIKIRIRNFDNEIDVDFPISENELYAKFSEIHAIEGRDAPQSAFVTEIYRPEKFSVLEGAVPADDEDDPKYATIGKNLVDRGLAQITAKGLLVWRG